MYTTHNDLVVRTVDVNGEPIRGVSVEVIERPIVARPLNPTPMVRKKREDVASQDYPKLDYDDEGQNVDSDSRENRDSPQAAGDVGNMYDYMASRWSDSSMSKDSDETNTNPTVPINAALNEASSTADADTDHLRDNIGENSDPMETNDESDEDEMHDNRESHKSQIPNDAIGAERNHPLDEDSTNLSANLENDSDAIIEIGQDVIDAIDDVGHKDEITDEFGEAHFARRPVGTRLLIEAKAQAGYYSSSSTFALDTFTHIFFSYKDATKVIEIEEEKLGTTTATIRMEYVDAHLAVTVVDKVNEKPLSNIAVSVDGPNNRRLESVTSDRGVAELKNVGYADFTIAIQAKSRG